MMQEEIVPPGEDGFIRALTAQVLAKVARDYPQGLVRRDAHVKQHGCVHAQFVIEPDLPPELRVGIFREPRIYNALVRFSNHDEVLRPDINKGILGMAIKLLGVPGDKLLEDERHASTQDFLLISTDRFMIRDVEGFYRLVRAIISGAWALLWYFLSPFNAPWRVAYILWRAMLRHSNPLHVRYWSVTPYRFGTRAVKYSAKPGQTVNRPIPSRPAENYLREVMQAWLKESEATFEFLVQFQVDPIATPIEDPSIVWSEERAPFRKVATLRIPPQTFDTPEQMERGEHLSFTPWHSLPEHRPLGGINRARKVAYREISRYRHERNGVPRVEPSE
jgi:hypothetical protein